MSEQVIVVTPEPETAESSESLERTVGQLETETEHLSEDLQELETETETAQETAEVAIEIAETAAETAWATRQDLETFKLEILTMLQNEEEEGQEESPAVEVIDLPEITDQPEQVEVQSEQTGFLATLGRMFHGK